jgi:hypothetical protein
MGSQTAPQAIHFEQYRGAATAKLPKPYRQRQPEKTILYQLIINHLETMLAESCTRNEHGFGYPRFIEREFRRYLSCGQLGEGFARVKCKSCGYEKLLAFACNSYYTPVTFVSISNSFIASGLTYRCCPVSFTFTPFIRARLRQSRIVLALTL